MPKQLFHKWWILVTRSVYARRRRIPLPPRQVLAKFGSVAALARAIGVSNNAIYKWLQGDGQPNLSNLVGLSRAARVSIEWLATGRGVAARKGATAPHAPGAGYTFMPRFDARGGARGRPGLMNDRIGGQPGAEQRMGAHAAAYGAAQSTAAEIAGDSMAPTLNETDLAIVDLGEPRFRRDAILRAAPLRRAGGAAIAAASRRQADYQERQSGIPAGDSGARNDRDQIGSVIWSGTRR